MLRKLVIMSGLILCLGLPGWGNSSEQRWDAGYTGAPGDGNCTACHSGAVNSFDGKVEIQLLDGSATYTPGVSKRLRVMITDAAQRRWGYQMSTRIAAGNGQAGTFGKPDANSAVVCSDQSFRTGTTCPTTGPIEYIGHTSVGTRAGTTGPVSFDIEWTPPSQDVGDVAIYVSGNAANNNGQNTGDHIYTTNLRLKFAAPDVKKPTFPADGVVNGASFSKVQPFSEGSYFSIFGVNLAPRTLAWSDFFSGINAPTELGGVRVFVNDVAAPVAFISPGQINVVAPAGTAAGGNSVVVQVNGVKSDTISVTGADVSPALFRWDPRNFRYAQATSGDGSAYIAPADLFGGPVNGRPVRPAKPGEVITLYGTGFGPTNPPSRPGEIPVPPGPTVSPVQARIGSAQLTPDYAGISGFIGVTQINVKVPALSDGDYEVVATIKGVSTPTGVFIPIKN